ncbi:MAG: OB-fold nucleic acid binding domain-containing protein [Candidatus Aenigmarchaeota archaeon]|nr:OB-fold nucleic acid binding domain-containing protein [Candidatus Aenigmarchaeota archaeon]
MNEHALLRASIVGFVISLILLYLISSNLNEPHVNIGDINSEFVGKCVNITGEIVNVKRKDGHIFLDVKDRTGKIKVILWNDIIHYLEMKNVKMNEIRTGTKINIVGHVQVFRGEAEIIPIPKYIQLLT